MIKHITIQINASPFFPNLSYLHMQRLKSDSQATLSFIYPMAHEDSENPYKICTYKLNLL